MEPKMYSDAMCGQATPTCPVSNYQGKADAWYRAKEHLEQMQRQADGAKIALAQAQQREAEAWEALKDVAGRGDPKPPKRLMVDETRFGQQ